MKEIRMNEKILDVICAVLEHRKFVWSDARAKGTWNDQFDIDKVNQEYYNSLPLPDGMRRNMIDYAAVLRYRDSSEIVDLCNTEYDNLGKFLWKISYE